MTRHYEENELLAWLDGNDEVVDLAAVEAHVAQCANCAARLDEVRADYKLLSDAMLWQEESTETTEALLSRVDEYNATRNRIARDAARANEVFVQLAARPLDTWLEHLALAPADCTDALIRRITMAARAVEEAEPKRALELLGVAEAIAKLVEQRPETAEAMGDLWKERANVLMVLGDYLGALGAIDEAEALYATRPVAAFDLAFTQWARANVFFEMGRYAEALPLGERAAAVFRQFGDDLHECQVRVLVACVLYEQGDIDAAERMFISLLQPLARQGDRVTEARVLANLACCRLFQDDLAACDSFASRAITMYAEFGMETEILRTRWALSLVYLRRGDLDRGMSALTAVAAEFQERGLIVDAAQVELDIVTELLRRHSYERAASIANRLATTFAAAEARIGAAKALAYLREAVLASSATPELVRTVRHALIHPDQPFIPSMPT